MLPRLGEPIRPGIRYVTRPGAYAILMREGQILLTHQQRPRSEVQLPGGGIDPGEAPLVALAREAREETGWSVSLTRRLGAYQRFVFMPEYDLWARKVCHIYLGRPVLRLSEPTEPGHTALWMAPEAALAELASPGDRVMLARYLGIAAQLSRGARRNRTP
ncbi:MAG: NUDIX hydrolase [Rhodobacteraceae bacterium]|nr:NUDIX hydrolase [Paracoccaceae bacterium]